MQPAEDSQLLDLLVISVMNYEFAAHSLTKLLIVVRHQMRTFVFLLPLFNLLLWAIGERRRDSRALRWSARAFKIPKYIKFVAEFPMTVTGKAQKFVMRKRMAEKLGLVVGTV